MREKSSLYMIVAASLFCAVCVVKNLCEAYLPKVYGGYVRCERPIHSFGEALFGETIEHEFSIQNVGTRSLEIANVITSCGCTTAGVDLVGQSIKPKGTLSVPVLLNVGVRVGEKRESLFIDFLGRPELRLQLTMEGRVNERIASPRQTSRADSTGRGTRRVVW